MRYITIDATEKVVKAIETDDFQKAVQLAGLENGRVDFGTVEPGVSIVVYEYSLFVHPNEQQWFTVGGKLYGGNALLFAHDERGETVDLRRAPDVKFFANMLEVERAIDAEQVERPFTAVNGAVIWRWPEPADAVQ